MPAINNDLSRPPLIRTKRCKKCMKQYTEKHICEN